jgi:hypothetical protein
MITFELFGIVKSKGKTIAVGDSGLFSTDNNKVISKLDQLGFKRIESITLETSEKKESELVLKSELEVPKGVTFPIEMKIPDAHNKPIKKPKGKKK